MARVTSDLWVSALIRRAQAEGAFATVLHKGAREAGAIFVVVSDLSGQASLFAPAPQISYDDFASDRLFECVIDGKPEAEIREKIARERSFDPDIWALEIEDREARSFIDNIVES